MWMVKNPEWFDVIVTDNMFGDIITDLGAMIQGGLGIACGGNINPQGISMFEPIGGSAPKYAGKNVINPLAAILAGAMMLKFLDQSEAAACIEEAVQRALKDDLKSVDAGRMGMGTREVGDLIVRYVELGGHDVRCISRSFLLKVLRFIPKSFEACEILLAEIFMAEAMKIFSIMACTL